MTNLVYLGLGSNLEDREAQLQRAVDSLARVGFRVLRASSTYETRPMYVTDQPLFLNMVVEGETELLPRTLVARLKQIEREMGRRPAVVNGPRIIDLDILLFGAAVIEAPELQVPHPRMAERRFVLEPLAELAPEWRHPLTGRTVSQMLAARPEEGIARTRFRVRIKTKGAGSASGAGALL